MKRILIAMLCVAVCVLSVFPLSACGKGNDKNNGNNGHAHSFTVEMATSKYLCSKATCTKAAKYYYSCECGAKGTETFEYGNANGHNIVNDVCKVCNAKASKGLEFELKDDDTYELKSIGTCTDKDIIIPKTYNNKAVTSIGNYALAAFGGVGAPILYNTPSVPGPQWLLTTPPACVSKTSANTPRLSRYFRTGSTTSCAQPECVINTRSGFAFRKSASISFV